MAQDPSKRTRRDAREWAVQLLFSLDLNPLSTQKIFDEFWTVHPHDDAIKTFTEGLINGVRQNLPRIDRIIAGHARNWNIARMAVLDRNVLRLAVYEMLYCKDIPPVVSINEAVDLAKYFNSSESGRFVNGILDQVSRSLEKQDQRS